MPLRSDVTVVTFDPFPTSAYSLSEAAKAHADYCAYLIQCFDAYKAECGAGHKTLEVIGKLKPPRARL